MSKHTQKTMRQRLENDGKRDTDAVDGPNFLSRFQIRDDGELVEGRE